MRCLLAQGGWLSDRVPTVSLVISTLSSQRDKDFKRGTQDVRGGGCGRVGGRDQALTLLFLFKSVARKRKVRRLQEEDR